MTPDKMAEPRWFGEELLRRLSEEGTPPEEAEWRSFEASGSASGITVKECAELCWIAEKLHLLVDIDFIKGQAQAVQALAAGSLSYKDIALAAAEKGDYGPLRGLIAKLVDQRAAESINPPPPEEWPIGKRRPLPKKLSRMTPAQREEFFKKLAKQANDHFRLREAYRDARRIRDLWREREGRAVRKRCGRSAAWFAAIIWELDEKKVANWKKPGGKKKSRA